MASKSINTFFCIWMIIVEKANQQKKQPVAQHSLQACLKKAVSAFFLVQYNFKYQNNCNTSYKN